MRYATFTNFDTKKFVAFWNGKPYTFQPGESKKHINASVVATWAKHLANKILTRNNKETLCSPKKPEDVPKFMEQFNKAYTLEGDGRDIDSETGLPVDDVNAQQIDPVTQPGMNIEVRPTEPVDAFDANAGKNADTSAPAGKPQVIGSASEGDDESEFEGTQE